MSEFDNYKNEDYDPDLIYNRPQQRRRRTYEDVYGDDAEGAASRPARQRRERQRERDFDDYRLEEDEDLRDNRRRAAQRSHIEPADGPSRRESRKDPAPEKEKRDKKEKKTKKERVPLKERGFVKFFCDSRLHGVIGGALCLLAVFMTFALISFIRNGADDQSCLAGKTMAEIVASGLHIGNIGGPIGAGLAQIMMVNGIGFASVVAIAYLAVVGLALMGFKRSTFSFWSFTFKSLLLIITLSVVLGLVSLWGGLSMDLGGYYGHYVNLVLFAYTNWIGALLVSLMLLLIVFYVYLSDITKLYNQYTSTMRARRQRADEEHEHYLNEREKVRIAMNEADEAMGDSPGGVSAEENKEEKPKAPQLIDLTDVPEGNTDADSYAIPDTDLDNSGVVSSVNAAEASADPTMSVVAGSIEEGDQKSQNLYDPTAELSRFKMPTLDLLRDLPFKANSLDVSEQEENKTRIIDTLSVYGIEISHIQATVGPTVTLYEIIPAEGVRISKIKSLEDDLGMRLAALGIRIIAPIPGKGTIGLEVPNRDPQTVSIRSILGSKKFQECQYQLPMALGATISNEVFIADLCKMPHLLVAGATGMGKSVGLNTIIASLLYKKHPSELKFVLIDPKTVEFSLYRQLENHYLAVLPDGEGPVVTQIDRVLPTLNSLCIEMENRYQLLNDACVRSITEYNERFVQRRLNPEKGHHYLPYIVMVVDEFADLIMQAKEVEKPIARIAQKARAVGMHLIIATQRPSVDVITGMIKANFPARIAFRVMQSNDSKTILDRTGANQLIGRGDMLISQNGILDRVQCAFIDTPEVEAICEFISHQPGFESPYYLPEPMSENEGGGGMGSVADRDSLFEECAEYVVTSGSASTSSLQRRYSIGYNRAGKIMDQLERAGIVGPSQGGKPRSVLIDPVQLGSYLNSLD